MMQQKLDTAQASDQQIKGPAAPARWTGTEVAAVIGAVGTLFASLGTVYTIYSNQQGKTLEQQGKILEKYKTENQELMKLVRYDANVWGTLRDIPPLSNGQAQPPWLDHKRYTGNCGLKGLTFNYQASSSPGLLHCSQGTLTLKMISPTAVLLLPDGPQGASK
jgi:hypothetical protein